MAFTVTRNGSTFKYNDAGRLHQASTPAVLHLKGATTFATSTAVALGKKLVAADIEATPFIYEVTVAGTTAGSAPTYPTTVGDTVVSGTATLKNIGYIAVEYWTDGVQTRDPAVGPAFRDENNSVSYMVNGRLHKEDGPAVIVRNAAQTVLEEKYYLNGNQIPADVYASVGGLAVAEYLVENPPE